MRTLLCVLFGLALPFEIYTRATNVISMSQKRPNTRPIIGILAMPVVSKYGDEYIRSDYVKFLESGGARVVPIRSGGGANTTQGPYYESGKIFYDLALQANDQGDYFPIWGTCLGLELLTVLTAKKYLLSDTDSKNLTLPLTLAEGYRRSHVFKHMPHDILNYLRTEPVAQNNHQHSILVKDFKASSKLSEFYKILSTNHGRDHLEFVSFMEALGFEPSNAHIRSLELVTGALWTLLFVVEPL
ncbi:gamma-glutamyl hydrolase [Elysia marginata]|uniref:folate gamma-glutamyl hydrolase n=1 Tax=Elysia marginata TaxID=1093978 RepID=A0AAV4IXF1_9GAST|nr:gamma-glutamyl hydrolase [Elysia marginata]